MSLLLTEQVADEAERAGQALFEERAQTVLEVQRVALTDATKAADALGGALLTLLDDRAACDAVLQGYVARRPQLDAVAMVSRSGRPLCTSDPALSAQTSITLPDLSQAVPAFRRLTLPGRSDLVTLVLPLAIDDVGEDAADVRIAVALSPPEQTVLSSDDMDMAVASVLVTATGEVLGGTGAPGALSAMLPDDLTMAQVLAGGDRIVTAASRSGRDRRYVVNEIVPGSVWGIATVPAAPPADGRWLRAGLLALPVLTWLVGMATAWVGMRLLVVSHVSRLRSAMRRFALGYRDGPLHLDNAPEEIESTAVAYNRMALILSEAEARAERDLQEKTILLREVHHRVKNNLQLISSIVNMQRRAIDNEDTRRVLGRLQRRVLGLATIHRTLYVSPDQATVDADALLGQLTDQAITAAKADGVTATVVLDLTPLALLPDQAVPLSMLAAEVLENALRFGGPASGDGPMVLSVRLTVNAGEAILEIDNSAGPERASPPDGLGERLIRAFALQLGGRIVQGSVAGIYRMTLIFPANGLPHDAGK